MRSLLIAFRKGIESMQYPELDQALRMYKAIQNLIAEMDEGMSFLMFTSTIFNAIPMYFGITKLLQPRDFTMDSETLSVWSLFIASYGAFIAMAVSGSLVGEANAKVVDQFKEMTSNRDESITENGNIFSADDICSCIQKVWLENVKEGEKGKTKTGEEGIEGESLSGDKNSSHKFKETFLKSVEEDYSRDDAYNIDETGVNWKTLPRKSLASKREPTAPGFKVNKERVTAMVYANASETHSLPLLVIGKSKKPRCFKNVSCLLTLYKVQKSVGMNYTFFSE
ncbi:jerky-like protein [Trichonephila inaurata madagascariensis]|uniref:Jerky-like protein n=1 Tax=Trichonephila inaurata madagascariensis TaxID=2747483 RepID=A0A8X6J5X7_9ARAC|nr:jerky-like protein [Trichonephila inaurata madagascariensis]